MHWLSLCLFLLLPQIATAAITFSEIAWMGTAESANYEWIELHNSGNDQDVTGWILTDKMNLSIELEGVVSSGQYVVLERTSDASVSGTAFLIYTGALVNTGATLQLKRADGSLVDQVAGGENWESVGGDNVTKETAQYTNAGWVTAEPSPGKSVDVGTVKETGAVEVITRNTTVNIDHKPASGNKRNASEPVRLQIPGVTLKLDVEAQTIGYVNQPIAFSVTATGIGKHLVDSLKYEWNFGDGLTSILKEPTHIFKYPGTYVVTVYAGYKRQEQVTRHEITILPVMVSLTMNNDGDVQLNNDSPYEIDISDYRVRSDKIFIFPERSIVLPNQTIIIPKAQLGETKTRLIGLYDSEAMLAASLVPSGVVTRLPQLVVETELEPEIKALSFSKQKTTNLETSLVTSAPKKAEKFETNHPKLGNFKFTDAVVINRDLPVSEDKLAENTNFTTTSKQMASVIATKSQTDSRWTYLALVVILGLGVLGVLASPKRNENS